MKGCRDAAKGAFKTDPESNNKYLLSHHLPSHTRSYRESFKENSKTSPSVWYPLKILNVQSIHQPMNMQKTFKTVQSQFCDNYYAMFSAHVKGQNSVYRCLCKYECLLKVGQTGIRKQMARHWYHYFGFLWNAPSEQRQISAPTSYKNHRWVFSSH